MRGGRASADEGLRLADGVAAGSSTEPARRLLASLLPRGVDRGTRVGSVVPPLFDAYARIFHPASRRGEPVAWREVARRTGAAVHPQMQWEAIVRPRGFAPEGEASGPGQLFDRAPVTGRCPRAVRVPLVDRFERPADPSSPCHLLVWTGFGGVEGSSVDAPRIAGPGREYMVLRASLDQVGRGLFDIASPTLEIGPSFWWPDDRSWCVATEVDFRWTYVGGPRLLIDAILADDRIEALETRLEHRGEYLSDTVNGPVRP